MSEAHEDRCEAQTASRESRRFALGVTAVTPCATYSQHTYSLGADPLNGVSLTLPPEVLEAIAERAAEILAGRQPVASGYLDVDGAAEFLACPKSRIYALVSADRIPHEKDGSRLLFDRDELRAYVVNGGAKRP